MTSSFENLSKNDLVQLLEFSHSTIKNNLNKENDLLDHVLTLKNLFDFDKIGCAYSQIDDFLMNNKEQQLVITNYPEDYLEFYQNNEYYLDDPVVIEYFSSFELVNWKEAEKKQLGGYKNEAVDLTDQIGLYDGFIHGTFDTNNLMNAVIMWGGENIENNFRTRSIIEYVTPFIAVSLENYHKKSAIKKVLSPKEIEVLNWIKEGKTSWEISKILNIAKRTVDFHANNIISKLNASNRIHAVAIAQQNGLIDF